MSRAESDITIKHQPFSLDLTKKARLFRIIGAGALLFASLSTPAEASTRKGPFFRVETSCGHIEELLENPFLRKPGFKISFQDEYSGRSLTLGIKKEHDLEQENEIFVAYTNRSGYERGQPSSLGGETYEQVIKGIDGHRIVTHPGDLITLSVYHATDNPSEAGKGVKSAIVKNTTPLASQTIALPTCSD